MIVKTILFIGVLVWFGMFYILLHVAPLNSILLAVAGFIVLAVLALIAKHYEQKEEDNERNNFN